MSFEEYQQLLAKSVSYKELDEATQQTILNATGADKEAYIQAFQQEIEMINAAYASFNKDAEAIVTEFKGVAAKDRKEKLSSAENAAHTEELNGAENMLKNL